MAASSVNGLAMQLQEYFDQLAPMWDKEFAPERLTCLKEIVDGLGIKPGDNVLDIGSGTGVLVPFIVTGMDNEGSVIAMDYSLEMLIQAQAKDFPPIVRFAQGDVAAIPLTDNSVDLAMCNSAFPHFSDKAIALREIARVLRTDGRLAICHTMSREMINQLHQSIGGAVANDLLPNESELREMMKQARLKVTHFEDRPERYLVVAEKSARWH